MLMYETRHELYKDYFFYLCTRVALNDHRGYTYFKVGYKLSTTPFKVVVEMDENRVGDALQLRNGFISDYILARKIIRPEADTTLGYWERLENDIRVEFDTWRPSMLEVLVAFSIKIEDSIGISRGDGAPFWFWSMLQNCRLENYPDIKNDSVERNLEIQNIIDVVNERKYNADGTNGGLFPVLMVKADMRDVELFLQFNGWLNEQNYNKLTHLEG